MTTETSSTFTPCSSPSLCPYLTWSALRVPGPIWILIILLAVLGLGDLLGAFSNPRSLDWFFTKILFIAGLLAGCRIVYIYFLFEGTLHVIGFLFNNPFVAALNLLLMILAIVSFRYFFPKLT